MAEYYYFFQKFVANLNSHRWSRVSQFLNFTLVLSCHHINQKETILEASTQSIPLREHHKSLVEKELHFWYPQQASYGSKTPRRGPDVHHVGILISSSLYSADRRPQHVSYSTPYEREHVRIVRQTPPSWGRPPPSSYQTPVSNQKSAGT